ncbi:MAG: 23S rRNA (adenine(2503)-C(2))-methyltransferase RlmN [Candidatus Omnitrophota bacterium]
MEKQDIKNLSLAELKADLLALSFAPYVAEQIFTWLYKKRISSFSGMSNISKGNISKLKNKFYIGDIALKDKLISKDGTIKFLFGLIDKEAVETVFIPAKNRNTLCLSSQVGCKFRCLFCASGKSFVRNLSVSEITSQLSRIIEITGAAVSHLVFMGIGEPLDNYDNVFKAVRIFNAPSAFNIGARRITISTCGIIPAIENLARQGLQVELSISLHAADNELRNKLMPVNKRYPLDKLISCVREYIKQTNRQITFEYILIKGLNDSLSCADKLSKLLSGLNFKVNLILFNLQEGSCFQPPDKKLVLGFKERLIKNGTHATTRASRGQDIRAACGQLRIAHN